MTNLLNFMCQYRKGTTDDTLTFKKDCGTNDIARATYTQSTFVKGNYANYPISPTQNDETLCPHNYSGGSGTGANFIMTQEMVGPDPGTGWNQIYCLNWRASNDVATQAQSV